MARIIQEHIKRPLAEEMLFGELADGGTAFVTVEDDQLKIISTALEESETVEQES
jgi:ATP-dependent Clp protease ATP-binding subunit ClpA